MPDSPLTADAWAATPRAYVTLDGSRSVTADSPARAAELLDVAAVRVFTAEDSARMARAIAWHFAR